jgi:linoleate 8R-lipoxygenase / 9,12-octadecadienoate 8-hydroperoxide 8R-isomerase
MGSAYQVDIVRDVAALANTHFSASLFSLPLKTEKCPHGIYTEQELYQVLSILFMSIFYDIDPMKSLLLRNAAKMLTQQLGQLVLFNVEAVSKAGVIADIVSKIHQRTELTDYGIHMIQRLLESGQSVKDVVWTNLMPTAASMVANQCQLLSQVLDYYLGDGAKHLKELNRLAKLDTEEANDLILR